MVDNYGEVNEQTLPLVNHLAKNRSPHAKALSYLALCMHLKAEDIEEYVNITSAIIGINAIRLVNEAQTKFPLQRKLSFYDFKILSVELMYDTTQKLLQNCEKQLVATPLCEWVAFLKEQLYVKVLVPDVDST